MQPHTAPQRLFRQVTALPQPLTLAARLQPLTQPTTIPLTVLRLRSTQVIARQQHSPRPARPPQLTRRTIIRRIARLRRFLHLRQQPPPIRPATQQVTQQQRRLLHRAVRRPLTQLAAVRPQRIKRAIRHRTRQRRHLIQPVRRRPLTTPQGQQRQHILQAAARRLRLPQLSVRHRHLQRLLLLLEAP